MVVSRYMRTQRKKSNLAKLILYKTAQGNVLNAARRLLYGISNRCKSLKVKTQELSKNGKTAYAFVGSFSERKQGDSGVTVGR